VFDIINFTSPRPDRQKYPPLANFNLRADRQFARFRTGLENCEIKP